MQKKIAIVGGGASGIMAAVTAAEAGAQVTVYEHMKTGKKILSTGNGKCNLTNLNLSINDYHTSDVHKLTACLEHFGTEDTLSFFRRIGLFLREKNGYIYPYCEQATVVLQVLLNHMNHLGITTIQEHVCNVGSVSNNKSCHRVWLETDNGRKDYYDAIILACGSKAAPKTGSDGSGYDIAKRIGHKLKPILPSLVQLRCKDSFCKELAGIRTQATIHIYDKDNKIAEEEGELQLTDYGISGIPVFQLSGTVNRYLYTNKNNSLKAIVDFVPDMDYRQLESCMEQRMSLSPRMSINELFCGTLNHKLCKVILNAANVKEDSKVCNLPMDKLADILYLFKNFAFRITGSNGFEQAQVCCGGVDLNDVTEQLESKLMQNIYFTGEILDVDGRCGGYNLQWAWTSGYIAGKASAEDKN